MRDHRIYDWWPGRACARNLVWEGRATYECVSVSTFASSVTLSLELAHKRAIGKFSATSARGLVLMPPAVRGVA